MAHYQDFGGDKMVLIPENPLSGEDNLKFESPWITPESTIRLDKLMRKTDRVIEFGCGGSTLFFARRAKSVVSFETNKNWLIKVKETARIKGLDNIHINHYQNKSELEYEHLGVIRRPFDVILVDSEWAICNRDTILALCSMILKQPRILVLDNYANKKGCPLSWNRTEQEFKIMFPFIKDHEVETYDYKGWAGKGTRIYINTLI